MFPGLSAYQFGFLSQVSQAEHWNYTKAIHVNLTCHSLNHNFRKARGANFPISSCPRDSLPRPWGPPDLGWKPDLSHEETNVPRRPKEWPRVHTWLIYWQRAQMRTAPPTGPARSRCSKLFVVWMGVWWVGALSEVWMITSIYRWGSMCWETEDLLKATWMGNGRSKHMPLLALSTFCSLHFSQSWLLLLNGVKLWFPTEPPPEGLLLGNLLLNHRADGKEGEHSRREHPPTLLWLLRKGGQRRSQRSRPSH